MALGPLAESTLQAALLGALSNVLAQFMQAYKNGVSLTARNEE